MFDNITFRAGNKARDIIQEEGLKPHRIKVLAGASGGPKWLVLSGIDRMLPELFKGRKEPLYVLGSSIGAWRAAALAQKVPEAAIERFEQSYLGQRYSSRPSIKEISDETLKVLQGYLNENVIDDILNHPYMRINILAVRAKRLGKSDSRILLGLNLAEAAIANYFSRSLLRFFFDRALFYDPRDMPPFFSIDQFPKVTAELSSENFVQAVLASGAIPMAMKGERDIKGAPPGVYRDGGIIDYHLDLPFLPESEDLVLYPHFYDSITPGWFDKGLTRRKPRAAHMDNVLLVSPSKEFVEKLPYQKIPDRKDFRAFDGRDNDRLIYWNKVLEENRRIGEEFREAIESNKIRNLIKPIEVS
ncbi:MAG: patatin-like phospholipase family protein [bacterium]|nr:patatin-like phospholipase family protein [bacterium]